MKHTLEISGKLGRGMTKPKIGSVVRRTLASCSGFKKNKKDVSVSLAFVDEKEIKKVNRTYRGKNEVTDVLSFSFLNQGKINEKGPLFLGELIICAPYVLKLAGENKISYSRQLSYVISHGILHLIGMKHSKKMYAIQDKISAE
jgi:probable rRNA maturation factor